MREVKQATPALIHSSWSALPSLLLKLARLEGSSIHMTKLVECPVVDSVPLRERILYTGHRYTPEVVSALFCLGLRCSTIMEGFFF